MGDMPRVPWELSGRDWVNQWSLIQPSFICHLNQGQFGTRTQGEGT